MKRLEAAGCETAALDARVLLADCLKLSAADLIRMQDMTPDADAVERYEGAVARRAAGEPVAYVTGCQEFWSLPFLVSSQTLIPRADSEALIECVLEVCEDRNAPLRILDLGTGSGCLLLTLLSEYPEASGLGVDTAKGALDVAAANATSLGLSRRARFVQGYWARGIDTRFDIVIANPPYICRSDIRGLQPEVRDFEPYAALDGGEDGLDAYREIFLALPELLAPDGIAVVEFGWNQADSVAALAENQGNFAVPEFRRDLGDHRRCAMLRLRGESPSRLA